MTGSWISLAIEGLVVFLLAVTIGYCMLLNSRLKRLKADESGLRKTISELVLATEIADRAINGLKQAAVECDKTLAKRVREAEYFSIEIAREVGEGKGILDRIAQITQAVRGNAERATLQRAQAAGQGAEMVNEADVMAPVLSRSEELRRKAQATADRLAVLRREHTERAA